MNRRHFIKTSAGITIGIPLALTFGEPAMADKPLIAQCGTRFTPGNQTKKENHNDRTSYWSQFR